MERRNLAQQFGPELAVVFASQQVLPWPRGDPGAAAEFVFQLPGGPTGITDERPHDAARPMRVRHGIPEPQRLQKALLHPLVAGSSNRWTSSSPAVNVSWSARTAMLAAWAEPVRLRQREQWQYWKKRNGGVSA